MVKETEKLDQKGQFTPHTLPISGGSPKGAMSAARCWQVSINPQQVSAIRSPPSVRSPENCRAGPHTCFVQSMSFIHTNTP